MKENLKKIATFPKNHPVITEKDLSVTELKLVRRIREETCRLNRNNVTRTKAYLNFYTNHPEIHWAFLGHMVSRNGGWNMTDLQGEFLPRLLTKTEREAFFAFLERGNWLIFQDAYPQFLLYQESLKLKKSMFRLLPLFGVSSFMTPIWDYFLKTKDTYILTIALVLNEQSYLESRVIQNPYYRKTVLETLEFKLQELFALSYILFPQKNGKLRLYGQSLQQFGKLDERIKLGKRLYSILFRDKMQLKNFYQWAILKPHTGSRSDYLPDLFHHIKEGVPIRGYPMQRLSGCKLKNGAARLYSPELVFAWKDVRHAPAESGDWFRDDGLLNYLFQRDENDEFAGGEIENEYCKSLEKLELAVLAKKAWDIFT